MDTRKRVYKRYCNQCGNYYEGRGQFYCSRECSNLSKERAKNISKSCKSGGNMTRNNPNSIATRFKKNRNTWNKGKKCPKISGNKNANWKGGRYISAQGYVYILKPNHPHHTKLGYVLEHRLAMEKKIGRYLRPEERVHHINEVKLDNRIENLQLFSSESEHQKKCHRPSWLA